MPPLVPIEVRVRGRVDTNEPHDRSKNDGEKGEGVGQMLPLPQALQPLAAFHSQDIDFTIGGFSPPEGRLARGFKPPAFSRFLFQSAVKSAESF